MNIEWNIQKKGSACVACNAEFEEAQTVHCFLNLQDPEGLRKDYCRSCWEETKLERAGIDFFSCWQSRYRKVIPVVKEEPVKKDQVEGMLKKYLVSQNPAHQNLCYLLAVMLERKKIITHKDTTTDPSGKKLLVYEQNKTGETFFLTDPELKLAQIAAVQQQVKLLLDEEMKQPATVV